MKRAYSSARYHYREREGNKSNEVIPRIATALLRTTTSNKSYVCAADTSCCNYRYRVTTRWSRFELSHRSFRKQSICHYEPRSLIRHRRMNNAWSRWKTSRTYFHKVHAESLHASSLVPISLFSCSREGGEGEGEGAGREREREKGRETRAPFKRRFLYDGYF